MGLTPIITLPGPSGIGPELREVASKPAILKTGNGIKESCLLLPIRNAALMIRKKKFTIRARQVQTAPRPSGRWVLRFLGESRIPHGLPVPSTHQSQENSQDMGRRVMSSCLLPIGCRESVARRHSGGRRASWHVPRGRIPTIIL